MNRGTKTGVTIVELCVVLGIISVLIAILIPAAQRVREAARETVCKNNVRQINLAMTSYAEVAGIPELNSIDQVGGWAIKILPLLEQQNLNNAISEGIPLTDLEPRHYQRPRIMQCPTQYGIRPSVAGEIESAHYVLNRLSIQDAPLSMELPWAASPDLSQVVQIENDGPHHGGYYSGNVYQHAVYFQND